MFKSKFKKLKDNFTKLNIEPMKQIIWEFLKKRELQFQK